MLTFFITGDLAVAIYLGATLLYILIIIVIASSMSLSIINPLYLGTIGLWLMMPLFIVTINSLTSFISRTALKTSLSRCLFPSFMTLSISTLPGLLTEYFASCKNIESYDTSYLVKRIALPSFVVLVMYPLLILFMGINPSQYSFSVTQGLTSEINVTLVIVGALMTISSMLLRTLTTKLVLLAFFTNPLTIPFAMLIIESEDIIFLLALTSLIKFVFMLVAYRYEEFKFVYIYFKSCVISFFSGILLATSILCIVK